MGFDPNIKSYGFIAQDLKEIFPELVNFSKMPRTKLKKDGSEEADVESKYYSVNYTGLIPILTEAIQEQQTIIDSQEDRVTKLESLVEQLLKK